MYCIFLKTAFNGRDDETVLQLWATFCKRAQKRNPFSYMNRYIGIPIYLYVHRCLSVLVEHLFYCVFVCICVFSHLPLQDVYIFDVCLHLCVCVYISRECAAGCKHLYPNAQRLCVYINLCCSGSKLPCMYRSLSLTQYAVWSCLQPHLSPSGDRRGYDSPKRSTFLADLHTWYLGGRGPLEGTLSCRWLLADRPCSPMPGPPPYRSGTCTRHSVPRPPGNVAWHVPRCCTQLAEWIILAKASLILSSGCLLWNFFLT